MEHPASLTCCFTGHRTIPVNEKSQIEGALLKAIAFLYTKGYRHFIAGGALGFDTMAANAVLTLKKRVKDITLTLILPCADQSAAWRSADKAVYDAQKAEADELVCLSEKYYDGCMQKRNAEMVRRSSACIAYLTRPRSGAGQTVRMAEKAGLTVINLASFSL